MLSCNKSFCLNSIEIYGFLLLVVESFRAFRLTGLM